MRAAAMAESCIPDETVADRTSAPATPHARGAQLDWLLVVLELAVFFLVAELSWRFTEAPILELKDRYAPAHIAETG